ncbi:MAG: pyridoxamine 5-phosphate oxidase [Cyanobacteria bacterium]|jgi:predicted pyridoxine 5'-phosphate oxidase superfamily flavin-nucleotide-binding protein|nr:pyridoxamine 5-phosphate oxidase [Cyanobacteria bacterium GSL.Bin1]
MSQCQDYNNAAFHAGERAVQAQAGVEAEAQQLSGVIHASLKPAAQKFLLDQSFAVAGTIDEQGKIWTSLLLGKAGFMQVLDHRTIHLTPILIPGDPLYRNLSHNTVIGLLVIDLANRRRLRINGQVKGESAENLVIQVQETFFNCPKYIQVRHLETTADEVIRQPQPATRSTLLKQDEIWITQADTFFISTYHPERGADTSHRGGLPRFVKVLSDRQLIFPDYAGNNMFQTFGNLHLNPQAGLLFLDFLTGSTLQFVGKAQVIWDGEQIKDFAGAKRLVSFDIDQILATQHAVPWRWQFGEYSPVNPR